MSYTEERNPFFEIRKEAVKTESGLVVPKVAIINDETDDILGLVSENYELITNEAVNDLFGEALNGLSIADISDHLDATTRRWKRRVVLEGDEFTKEVLPGDSIGLLLEVFNGYDARTAFGYELMGYRSICSNGMVLGKTSLMKESYTHYVDNPEKLRLSVNSKLGEFNENVLTWKQWTQIPFGQENFNTFVDSRAYLGKKVAESIKDTYESVMNREKLEENKYGAYNVLTFLATHETKARKGSNIFSSRYNAINRMAADMYGYEEVEEFDVVVNG
jgi:hypothetical protein